MSTTSVPALIFRHRLALETVRFVGAAESPALPVMRSSAPPLRAGVTECRRAQVANAQILDAGWVRDPHRRRRDREWLRRGPAKASANAATAYNAEVAVGATGAAAVRAAPAPTAAVTAFAMGVICAVLPAGCITPSVQGTAYCLHRDRWVQPSGGADGVSCRALAAD